MPYDLEYTVDFGPFDSLTLNAKLFDDDVPANQVGATIVAGFANHGDGSYSYLATLPDEHVGSFVIYDSAEPTRKVRFAVNVGTSTLSRLSRSAITIVNGQAVAGTLSTTQMSTDLVETTDDHFNGRVLIWSSGTLLYQAAIITDYDGATKVLTFTAITEAPLAGDDFIII